MKEMLKTEIVRLANEQKKLKQERREAALVSEDALSKAQSKVAMRRNEIRAHLLAYAMLRDTPRKRVERSYREPVNPWTVYRVLGAFGSELGVDTVRAWLAET